MKRADNHLQQRIENHFNVGFRAFGLEGYGVNHFSLCHLVQLQLHEADRVTREPMGGIGGDRRWGGRKLITWDGLKAYALMVAKHMRGSARMVVIYIAVVITSV